MYCESKVPPPAMRSPTDSVSQGSLGGNAKGLVKRHGLFPLLRNIPYTGAHHSKGPSASSIRTNCGKHISAPTPIYAFRHTIRRTFRDIHIIFRVLFGCSARTILTLIADFSYDAIVPSQSVSSNTTGGRRSVAKHCSAGSSASRAGALIIWGDALVFGYAANSRPLRFAGATLAAVHAVGIGIRRTQCRRLCFAIRHAAAHRFTCGATITLPSPSWLRSRSAKPPRPIRSSP